MGSTTQIHAGHRPVSNWVVAPIPRVHPVRQDSLEFLYLLETCIMFTWSFRLAVLIKLAAICLAVIWIGNGTAAACGEEGEAEAEAPLPASTTVPVLEAALEPVMTPMRACLTAANARSARLVLDLDGDGTVRSVVVAPETLGECLEPLIRQATFRGNARNAREQVRYTLRR